jgi:hypothetical protein
LFYVKCFLEMVTTLYIAVFIPGIGVVFDLSLTATNVCGVNTRVEPVTTTYTASFSWTTAGMLVSFTDQITGTQPLGYLWDFGDGTTSTEQSPTHLFTSPGIFPVSLTVNAPRGVSVYKARLQVGRFFLPLALRYQQRYELEVGDFSLTSSFIFSFPNS